MATYAAIAATSRAILGVLETAAATDPEFATATFSLFTSADLKRPAADPLTASLYLYHVAVNSSRRGAPGRRDATGTPRRPPVPLDLHYLLTAWGKDADTQQRLLGWCARMLADVVTLPAGVLNASAPSPVFRSDETVELVWEALSQQDMFAIWDVSRANQQPSAAYVARIVELESTVDVLEGPLVQATRTDYHPAVVG